jgi:hypothetical protein
MHYDCFEEGLKGIKRVGAREEIVGDNELSG